MTKAVATTTQLSSEKCFQLVPEIAKKAIPKQEPKCTLKGQTKFNLLLGSKRLNFFQPFQERAEQSAQTSKSHRRWCLAPSAFPLGLIFEICSRPEGIPASTELSHRGEHRLRQKMRISPKLDGKNNRSNFRGFFSLYFSHFLSVSMENRAKSAQKGLKKTETKS